MYVSVFVCVSVCVSVCMCTIYYVWSHKKVLDPLGLCVALSLHLGAGNQTGVLQRSQLLRHLSSFIQYLNHMYVDSNGNCCFSALPSGILDLLNANYHSAQRRSSGGTCHIQWCI